MSELYLPDRVRHQIEFERQLEKLNERHGWLKHFDAELRRIDPYLSLVKASENADRPGLIPGMWHVKRDNPTAMPTFIPLRTPDGKYAEPSMYHLEMVKKLDMQRPGALEEFVKRQEQAVAEAERQRANAADERREEMAERIEAIERPSVSMSGGWTNSTRGNRAKR